MRWTTPGDPGYDEQRTLFNAMIDKRPRAIAACAAPAEVAEALRAARDQQLRVAVRAGGHSVAGLSSVDDGLVVDLRPMKQVEVDPVARRASVGAGVTWAEFDAAAQEHGLAVTGGRVSTTGVAGFTLGGGSGWLDRKLGLACDHLVSVDLVTADGREVTASAQENPELFWALHGGGGNFGVATRFVFRLQPVGPTVLAGVLAWPVDHAPALARAYRDWAQDAPDELGSALFMVDADPDDPDVPAHLQGQPVMLVPVLWAGDLDEGRDYVGGLRLLEPEMDLVQPRPYAEFQQMLDDPPGNRHYWSADYHDELSDEALDVFVAHGLDRASPLTQQIFFPWGGAAGRVPPGATPMTQRDASWVSHPFAVWQDPADDAANIAWVRRFRRDLAPYTSGGVYLNFVGIEGEERVRRAYGAANYDRLVQVKTAFDPGNVFRGNQNIAPLVTA